MGTSGKDGTDWDNTFIANLRLIAVGLLAASSANGSDIHSRLAIRICLSGR